MSNSNENQNQNQTKKMAENLDQLAKMAPNVSLTLSAADIKELIVAAIRASKEPTPEEQAKMDAEAEAARIQREQWKEEAETWLHEKVAMQNGCDHKKPRGEACTITKVFSDGHSRTICLRCQKITVDNVVTPEQFQKIMQSELLGNVSWENFSKMQDIHTNTPEQQAVNQ